MEEKLFKLCTSKHRLFVVNFIVNSIYMPIPIFILSMWGKMMMKLKIFDMWFLGFNSLFFLLYIIAINDETKDCVLFFRGKRTSLLKLMNRTQLHNLMQEKEKKVKELKEILETNIKQAEVIKKEYDERFGG